MRRGKTRTLDRMGAMDRHTWHGYQERAAAVFSKLGCSVVVDAKVKGVRASHQIDVLVRFTRWGLNQIWIIECKHHRRRITKAAVEALKSIVQDVGAEKGFVLSELGFQPAAIAAARNTNVSLISLAKLEAGAAPDVQQHLLALLEKETLRLMKLTKGLSTEERGAIGEIRISPRPGVQQPGGMGALGALVGLLHALQDAKTGDYREVIPKAFPNLDGFIRVSNTEVILSEGFRLVSEVKSWIEKQEKRIRRAERRLASTQRRNARTAQGRSNAV
jgi:hypothetical protein